MKDNNLSIAIIGCGNIYQIHADAIRDHDQAYLLAVVDNQKERVETAAAEYNCTSYQDYQEMLKEPEIDVVHICTPHHLHYSMAIDCLEAGKHVLVEKPMAKDVDGAKKMIDKAQKTEKKMGVVFQNRYNKTSIKAREMIDDGEIGSIKGIKGIVTWHRNQEYYNQDAWRGRWETEGGGVLINQSIHTLDLLQWLGGNIKAIKGHVDTRILEDAIEVEDTAEATLYFDSGAKGLFYATNCFSTNSPVEIVIHGERGLLKITNNNLILQRNGEKQQLGQNHKSQYKTYWGKGHKSLINDFYDNIINDTHNYIKGKEGIKSLELIKGIYQSSQNNKKYYFSRSE